MNKNMNIMMLAAVVAMTAVFVDAGSGSIRGLMNGDGQDLIALYSDLDLGAPQERNLQTPECTDGDQFELIRMTGSTLFPESPDGIEVVATDTTTTPNTVTVDLKQFWTASEASNSPTNTMNSIFAYYHQTVFDRKCEETKDVAQGLFETITITCNYMSPVAYLQICVADSFQNEVLVSKDDAKIPDCCYPEFPPETGSVCYVFEISCVPKCEVEPPPTLPPVADTNTAPPVETKPPIVPTTKTPTTSPTASPTASPTTSPTTTVPTTSPTESPTKAPTSSPTSSPTTSPTASPTASSTFAPTESPTKAPTASPTQSPTKATVEPTQAPTKSPTVEPTENPTSSPTKLPTASPTKAPSANPTSSPTKVPTANPTPSPSKSPTGTPTKAPINRRTAAPTVGLTSETNLDCAKLQDLGFGFSEATGNPHYSGKCYPSVVSLNANNLPGRDDSVAVFVGGSYYGKNAAEVEGNMVVLGDLKVDNSGPGNFVSVGVGTHVLPNSGGECIKVGGSITASRNIQVFNQATSMYCDIVYKGSASGKNKWKTNGEIRQDPNLDLSEYEAMKTVWRNKSKYWATLPSTGTVDYKDWGSPTGETRYQCTNKDEIQVFNVLANERKKVEGVHTIYFSDNCEGKTILINVHGGSKRKVDAAAMYFKGKQGYNNDGFANCLKSSILWNFPDADTVDIGNGKTSEFQGSLLITGNLEMTTTGQSGRTIVLGDITHNRGGSEFHSYEYNPPQPLPDPDCEDLLSGDISIGNGDGSSANTQPVPTNKPTNAPTIPLGDCKAIPQSRLPSGSWETSDNDCSKCKPPNNVNWWPCDQNPPLCEGNCVFNI